jgi:PRTRC genetic system protein A
MFADYKVLQKPQQGLPPIRVGKLYEYVLAANGVYLHAKRQGLEVFLPVMAPSRPTKKVRGLCEANGFVKMDYPKVPYYLLEQILTRSVESADEQGKPLEILFHLVYETSIPSLENWYLKVPEQEQHYASVKPVGSGVAPGSSYETAFIDCHSHHGMRAFFSGTDDRDEQGFRIYAVLGNIYKKPELRVRVGVFGHHFEIEAGEIFELPYEGKVIDARFGNWDALDLPDDATEEDEELAELARFEEASV